MKNTAHTVVDPSKSQERCNGVAPNLFESNILKRFAEISLSNNISELWGPRRTTYMLLRLEPVFLCSTGCAIALEFRRSVHMCRSILRKGMNNTAAINIVVPVRNHIAISGLDLILMVWIPRKDCSCS
jgi:hypothetical protein